MKAGIIMNSKYLILLIVLASIFLSGCAEEKEASPSEEGGVLETEAVNETATASSGQDHIVRLEFPDVIKPSTLEIKKGDTVSWWNHKKQDTYVLVSEDMLFSDQKLAYRVPFHYTFSRAGTYRFTVANIPSMNMTVNVS